MSDIPGTYSITELIKAQLPTIQEESANGCYSQSHDEIEDWLSETLLSPTATRTEGIAATTPQHSFKIPKKTMLGKARTQKKSYHPFSERSSTTVNSMAISDSVYNHHNQSHLVHYSSDRPLTQCNSSEGCPLCVWSVGSLMAVLPDSPSPICSGYSSPRDSRNQSSDVVSFDSKRVTTTTSTEIDKWMDNSRTHLQRRPNLVKAGDHELSSQTLPPVEEES
ncbi:uncharacterized protein LOC115986536 [Quercus lobata]|uniref:uncharacterized protein LOC115986536 n=1 Tax=Quercus lobata TaxID=97700 RepID=UPI0012452013|nr:uncharacterized protein LOC115986536 [Quercus lobata]